MTKMTAEEANTFLKGAFETQDNRSEVVLMEDGRAVMRLVADSSHLRPGGYISGPTQMALVDSAAYMAVMTKTGQALAVMDVDVRIEGAEKPSSHAVVTYAIPRQPSGMA